MTSLNHKYKSDENKIEDINMFIDFSAQLPPKNYDMFKKHLDDMKRELRKIQKDYHDPLFSIKNGWHTYYDSECGDSWYEYAIFKDNGQSDEDIESEVEDMRMEIHSAYDCTALPFTKWISWSRQPAGIVIVHAIGLDI